MVLPDLGASFRLIFDLFNFIINSTHHFRRFAGGFACCHSLKEASLDRRDSLAIGHLASRSIDHVVDYSPAMKAWTCKRYLSYCTRNECSQLIDCNRTDNCHPVLFLLTRALMSSNTYLNWFASLRSTVNCGKFCVIFRLVPHQPGPCGKYVGLTWLRVTKILDTQ